jgi:hypothetical protein
MDAQCTYGHMDLVLLDYAQGLFSSPPFFAPTVQAWGADNSAVYHAVF